MQSNQPFSTQAQPWYRTGLGALVIVLALVGGACWIVRRWVPTMRGGERGILHVVSRTSLTPKHHLALVRLGSKFVVVGISPEQVTALCEIDDPGEVAELAARTGIPYAAKTFDEELAQESSDYVEPPGTSTIPAQTAHRRAWQKEQPLKDLLRKVRKLQTT